MATDLDEVLFTQHLAEIFELPECTRWHLERDESVPLGVTVVLHSSKAPDDLYKALISWTDYFRPFSLKFLNMATGSDTDPTAWPVFFGSRPQAFVCCVPYTAEGHVLHLDWATLPQGRFEPPEMPLQFALLTLQRELDSTYEGRFKQ